MMQYLSEIWDLAKDGSLQGVWFFAAAYGLLMCGYSLVFQLRIRRWPTTIGQLHHLGVEVFGGGDAVGASRVGRAAYSYEVDGRSYEGTRVSPWVMVAGGKGGLLVVQQRGVERHDGGRVTVLHHPTKPAKSYLIRPGVVGMGITVLLGMALAVGYVVRFHT